MQIITTRCRCKGAPAWLLLSSLAAGLFDPERDLETLAGANSATSGERPRRATFGGDNDDGEGDAAPAGLFDRGGGVPVT